ncbi:MAG: IS256 family transposase [Candidatus Aminicenantes bacterium]|nr:IS256 family transposase [Candidatus Aminicenantes bacterium]
MAPKNYKEVLKKMLVEFINQEDPLLAMLEWLAHQLMQIEAESKVGAAKGKHSPERRTYFSGKRVRRVDTRVGTIYLFIPKLRKGGYIPFFLTQKKRSEAALMALIQEAFINGVSTRKIERLARSLGIESISAAQVSEINKGLSQQVDFFRNRPLESEYPFLWIDALYEKVREGGRVISIALMIAYGINLEGKRDILAIEPMYEESEESWREFFRKLKRRGVRKIRLCISDAHLGLQKALKSEWIGSSWQRCKVHFMRNIMARVPHREKKRFAEKLKQIWLQPDKESALQMAEIFSREYEKRFPQAIRCLEEGLEDSLQFYDFPEIDKRKISSTNVVERIIREIRRRSRVIGVFPSQDSYVRLITSYLVEYSEDWLNERSYIKQERLIVALDDQDNLLEAQVF